VRKRWLVGGGIWIVGSALAFWLLNAILAAFVAIVGLTVVAVLALAADWNQHSTFEERELARSRKRAAKQAARRERTKDARAKDRARWEAHQARKAARAAHPER
jgi:type IV secretory pathway VirB6-like protein